MKQKTLHGFFLHPPSRCASEVGTEAAAVAADDDDAAINGDLQLLVASTNSHEQQRAGAASSVSMDGNVHMLCHNDQIITATSVSYDSDNGADGLELKVGRNESLNMNSGSDDEIFGTKDCDGSSLPTVHHSRSEFHLADERVSFVPFKIPKKKRSDRFSSGIHGAELSMRDCGSGRSVFTDEAAINAGFPDGAAYRYLSPESLVKQISDCASIECYATDIDGGFPPQKENLQHSLRKIASKSGLTAFVSNHRTSNHNHTSRNLDPSSLRTQSRYFNRQKHSILYNSCGYHPPLESIHATGAVSPGALESAKQPAAFEEALSHELSDEGNLMPSKRLVNLEAEKVQVCQRHSLECEAPGLQQSNKCEQFQTGKSRRAAAPLPQAMEAPITEYEMQRNENIHKNNMFLQKLGIQSTMASLSAASSLQPARAKIKSKLNSPPTVQLRRSSRMSVKCTQEQPVDEAFMPQPRLETSTEPVSYGDSSVWVYTCCKGCLSGAKSTLGYSENLVSEIKGFQPLSRHFYDPNLSRIYTMDMIPVGNDRVLLVAGGRQGHMAVFGTCNGSELDCSSTRIPIEDEASVHNMLPLLSWKGCKGWISQVKFLSLQAQEGSMLMVSSSNDSSLILWDINKQEHKHQSSKVSWKGLPRVVAETKSLHSNGIFGMHEIRCQIVTASKDGTLGVCRVSEASFLKERIVSGHHSSTIKCARFWNNNIAADGGDDGVICILDLRLPQPLTLRIQYVHASGVNVVEWNTCSEHMLLSASNDPYVLLHDIRNHSEPLHKLFGHISPQLQRSSCIYRPAFVDKGRAVATPGEGSKQISLYSVSSGRAISRGHVGFDANMVMSNSSSSGRTARLWLASQRITEYAPLWQEKEIITFE